ncbi:MAG: F-type H+/Na+-transporting ATPase subunit alpha, partial [Pseudonocardiales bacterium]|nr:F-type H+/Na+-transporting ATPase subunit alpha [Pseudonocardiales bacterium]
INVGISVSRVGGAAQPKAMRAVAGRLRVDLAQYRELEAFAAFGSDLDRASQQQLARGGRLVELLKQPAASPFPIGREITSIWAGTNGKLDDIEVSDVRRFESEFLDFVGHQAPGLYDELAAAKSFDEALSTQLDKLVDDFKKQFQATEKSEDTGERKSEKTKAPAAKSDTSAPDDKTAPDDKSEQKSDGS